MNAQLFAGLDVLTSSFVKQAEDSEDPPVSAFRRFKNNVRAVAPTVGKGLLGTAVGMPLGYLAGKTYEHLLGRPSPQAVALGTLATGAGAGILYQAYQDKQRKEMDRAIQDNASTRSRSERSR